MELVLLKDIVIIFALSLAVNFLFTRMKVPSALGYLLTGIIAGPHLLSLIHGEHEIELLAEIGVVFLLFTIGMEFSLKHLVKIRRIVFLGGLLQVSITALVFYFVSGIFGLDTTSSLFIGFLTALSSSALVLKLLQERSELTSNYGRTILGILIFQDILLVPLILFTNFLGNDELEISRELLILAIKAVIIIAFVYVGNKWLFPKILQWIALTKNQELFMMSIFLICLSVAYLTYELGMSLAFGAFIAGLMISESKYSHNAFSNFVPFKDIFTSFFFVSIGMLLDLQFVINNYQIVILTVVLVVVLKTIIAGATGFVLGHTFRGTVVVGLALSQVGEFSFILAKIGLDNSILDNYYYQLFLATAVITMSMTPFLMQVSRPLSNVFLKLPLPTFLVKGLFPLKEIDIPEMKNHMVIIGRDATAVKLAKMAKLNNIPYASIIFDPLVAKERMDEGDFAVYGDATNEPILEKVYADKAEIIIISVSGLVPSMAILSKVRQANKKAYIIIRSKYVQKVEELYELGADQVIAEKLEIAIDLFNRALIKKLYPQKEINRILTHMRSLNLGEFTEKDVVNQPSAFDELPNMNISAIKVDAESKGACNAVSELQLRKTTGAILLAIKKGNDIIEHPEKETLFEANDIAYVLGNPEQVNRVFELFTKE